MPVIYEDEWIELYPALWKPPFGGMNPDAFERMCQPGDIRVRDHGPPLVRLTAWERVAQGIRDQDRRDAGYKAWRAGWGHDLTFHVQRAKDDAAKAARRRMPKVFQFMGPGGAIGGEQLPDSPEITARIREAMIEAAEHAEREFRRKNPELDQGAWEKKFHKK